MGEFEKRVRAFQRNTLRLKVLTDQQSTLVKDSMLALVEEAKKEFPVSLFDLQKASVDPLTDEQCHELVKWVEKWFGDGK